MYSLCCTVETNTVKLYYNKNFLMFFVFYVLFVWKVL